MDEITLHGLVRPEVGRANQPSFTNGIDGFDAVNHSPPLRPVAVEVGQSAMLQSNLPINEIGVQHQAWRQPSFADDFYYRVHVRPGVIELGNLLSAQTRQVEVWNAWFGPQRLQSIATAGTDGITLAQPAVPPTDFAALESRNYALNISTSGSPVINASYAFTFEHEIPVLNVTGRRVVVWPFVPYADYTESLEWRTDVLKSFNNEQRIALRTAPRQGFSYRFFLDERQFSRAKAIASQWAHRVYGVPVWSEHTRLGALKAGVKELLFDTAHADYRDGDILLIWDSDEHFAAVEIQKVLADRITLVLPLERSFAQSVVMPLRFARTLQGMEFKRIEGGCAWASATFDVTQNTDLSASAYPQYRGRDVLLDASVLVGDLKERIARQVDVFDNGSGPVEVDICSSFVDNRQTLAFHTANRAKRWEIRQWIHARRGRQKTFWLPSWNRDLVIVRNVGAAASALTVEPIGYSLYFGQKDILLELRNGQRYFNRVLGAAVDPDGNEVLSLEKPFGVAFDADAVERVCFMHHMRFDADRIEIQHTQTENALVVIPVVEIPE